MQEGIIWISFGMFGVDLAIVQVDVTRQVNAQWNRAERIQLIVHDLDLLKTLEPVDFYSVFTT